MTTINLTDVNKLSNLDIHFLNSQLDDLKLNNTFNLIFSQNGIYLNQHYPFGDSFIKTQLPYTNLSLTLINQQHIVKINIPKPSIEYLENILNVFKYVQDKTKNEFMIILYWDIKNNKFEMDYLDQIVTMGSVKYNYSDKFEQDSNYIKYLEIHSHHSMGANFSSIDDNDEKCKSLCFYGVIGNLNSNSTIYTMGSKFRIWNGLAFSEIKLSDVFDMPNTPIKPIPDINVIDNILKASAPKQNSFPTSITQYTTVPEFSKCSILDFKGIATQFLKVPGILIDEYVFINTGEDQFNLIVDSNNGIIILQFNHEKEDIVINLDDEIEIKVLFHHFIPTELDDLLEELKTLLEWSVNE